jgi:nucleoside-diphosphate-sugar epimerase
MDTILITGATGFLGSKVLEMLIENNYKVLVLKRKNSDTKRVDMYLEKENVFVYNVEELGDLFQTLKIDIILHLATCYGRNNESYEEILESNFYFPQKLIDLSIEFGVNYFINTHTVLKSSANFYATTKHQLFDYLNSKSTYFNKIINVIPEYFYGAGDSNWKLMSMLISKLHQNIHQIDLTTGKQKRNFIYISDLVEAYKIILENLKELHEQSAKVYIGTDDLIMIKELALICKSFFPESSTVLNFGALADRIDDVDFYDNQLISNWGWKPKVSLKEGIEKTIIGSKNLI